MKKYITLVLLSVMTLGMFSCTKEADVAAIEPNLPSIALSSLGSPSVSPLPLAGGNLVINFGATTTGATPAAFKLEFYANTSATGTVIKTINFPSWTGSDDAAGGHTILYTNLPTSYPNTQIYGGQINLKLSTMGLTSGKTYSVKASAYKVGSATPVTFSASSLFKVI